MKKANAVADGAMIMAVLFTIVMAVIILHYSVIKPLNTDIQADDDFSTQAKQISQENTDDFSNFWDYAIPFIFIFMWAAAIVSSQYIDAQPAYFVFTVIGLIVILLVAMSIEQSYEDTISDPEYAGFEIDWPKTHFLMQNIVPTMLVVVLSIGVALYAKG